MEGWGDRRLHSRTWKSVLLGRTPDNVIGEDIAAASHGDSHPVLVVLEDIVRYVGVEGLHHCQSRVPIVVDVVT